MLFGFVTSWRSRHRRLAILWRTRREIIGSYVPCIDDTVGRSRSVKSSEDVDRPQAGGKNSREAGGSDYAKEDEKPFVGFFMGTSSFLVLTSYFLPKRMS